MHHSTFHKIFNRIISLKTKICDDCLLGSEEQNVVFIMTNTLIET